MKNIEVSTKKIQIEIKVKVFVKVTLDVVHLQGIDVLNGIFENKNFVKNIRKIVPNISPFTKTVESILVSVASTVNLKIEATSTDIVHGRNRFLFQIKDTKKSINRGG